MFSDDHDSTTEKLSELEERIEGLEIDNRELILDFIKRLTQIESTLKGRPW